MNINPHLGLLCAALLAGCEKPGERDKSAPPDASIPASQRAQRGGHAAAPANRHQDLRDSLAAAQALAASEARDQALAEVVGNALESAPDIASAAFGQLAVDSAIRMQTISQMAIFFGRKDPAEALAWADLLGSAAEIAAAKGEIALILAEEDPVRAVNVLLGPGVPKGELDEAKVEVIRQWAGKAPTDAATWVLNLPAGDARRAGIEAVASRWLETDAAAAFAWLAASTNQSVRAEVSRAMAQALAAQPGFIREGLMENADAAIRGTLEQQVKQITEQAAKDNPSEPKLPDPSAEFPEPSAE